MLPTKSIIVFSKTVWFKESGMFIKSIILIFNTNINDLVGTVVSIKQKHLS